MQSFLLREWGDKQESVLPTTVAAISSTQIKNMQCSINHTCNITFPSLYWELEGCFHTRLHILPCSFLETILPIISQWYASHTINPHINTLAAIVFISNIFIYKIRTSHWISEQPQDWGYLTTTSASVVVSKDLVSDGLHSNMWWSLGFKSYCLIFLFLMMYLSKSSCLNS